MNMPAYNRSSANTRGNTTTSQVRTDSSIGESSQAGTLRLRGAPSNQQRVQWAEDVIDNEGMGKKSSKVCCIYHKPRPVDESSDESSDSSDSSSGSSDDGRTIKDGAKSSGDASDEGCHDQNGNPHHCHVDQGKRKPKRKDSSGKAVHPRNPSPNAYEKLPTNNSK